MIQDMFGNEFYAGAYKDGSLWRTNRYRDVSQFPMGSSPDMLIWERHLLLYPGSRIESRSMEKVVRKGARAQFCANHKEA
ncbi:mini-chromosome maintenance complex-binding protein-like isoform X3 [Syzygium oleosum]|uniref:mini-chromosome maintenance complex-binding protein-like isoform X3 n=1 Tax=Syzygium oleosum TaxID=219896 RepID=UPI0024BA4CE9|nr:mini-chromosome maintenance complex-binding protein-like isoform X3 [Syzygium oleosum]